MPTTPGSTHPQAARVAGGLFTSGSFLVLFSLALPHPAGSDDTGLLITLSAAIAVGLALFAAARRIPVWALHGSVLLAPVLVGLCIFFSGTATGVYSGMLIWVVLWIGYFFPGRPTYLHLAWLTAVYAVTLGAVDSSAGFASFTRWVLTMLVMVVAGLVMSILSAGRQREMRQRESLERELAHLATHDALTGVANRRRLEQELPMELARARRHSWTLCVACLDLDEFKTYNDTHGHGAGDELLKAAAQRWDAVLRETDLLARLGGDEFVVVLPDCPPTEGQAVAARLRAATPKEIGCSAGIAVWDGDEAPVDLLRRADASLYQAKDAGKAATEA